MKLLTKSVWVVMTLLLIFNLTVAEAASGPAGPAGPKGATGATGPMGPKGNPGFPGLLGPKGATGAQGEAGTPGTSGSSCTPYFIGATGPDGGVVAYVDGTGCHGIEAQTLDELTTLNWDNALIAAAAYNTITTNTLAGYICTTVTAVDTPKFPYCWHLPSKNELSWLYEQKAVVGGFLIGSNSYWSSSESIGTNAWNR